MRFLALRGFLEADFHRVAEVAAAIDLLAAGAPALAAGRTAEDVAEDVAEGLGEAPTHAVGAAPTTEVGIDPGVAVLVVGRSLRRVGEHLVGFLALLELVFRLGRRVALVAVGVVLHRMLAISLFDVVVTGVLRHAQHFVVVALAHLRIIFLDAPQRVARPSNTDAGTAEATASTAPATGTGVSPSSLP